MEQIAVEAGVPPTRISFMPRYSFIQNCWLICAAMAPAASRVSCAGSARTFLIHPAARRSERPTRAL